MGKLRTANNRRNRTIRHTVARKAGTVANETVVAAKSAAVSAKVAS